MGSFRQNRADRLLSINTDSVFDIQVKTGGVDAAAPLGSGAVISVATKSGTNKLGGSAGAIFTPKSWNGDNAGGGNVRYNEMIQPDLSLSGPIVRDKVWFFGSYRYTHVNSGIGRTAEQIATLTALKPDFEPFDNQITAQQLLRQGDGAARAQTQAVRLLPARHPSGRGQFRVVWRSPRHQRGGRQRLRHPAPIGVGVLGDDADHGRTTTRPRPAASTSTRATSTPAHHVRFTRRHSCRAGG